MKRERSVKPKRGSTTRRGRKPSASPLRRPASNRKRQIPHEQKAPLAPAAVTAENPSPIAAIPISTTPPKVAIITTENSPQGIVLMKLPPKRVLSFTWSWFWRSLVYTLMVTVAAMIIAFGAGFLAGIIFIVASPNDSAKQIFLQAIGMLIGGMVGFGSLPFFLQWMTTHKLGKFRLLLLGEDGKDVR